MKIVVDAGDEKTPLIFDKVKDRAAIVTTDDSQVLMATGGDRCVVGVSPATEESMRCIADCIKLAEQEGRESGCLVVRGDKVGFVSVG